MRRTIDESYSALTGEVFSLYQRMQAGPARLALAETLIVVEASVGSAPPQGQATVETEIDTLQRRNDMLTEQIHAALGEGDYEPDVERAELVDTFNQGFDAFFPESLTMIERIELFDRYCLAAQRPNGRARPNRAVYQARADVIERLIDKRFDTLGSYHGIDVRNIFESAVWLRGPTETEIVERGWSVDPVDVFRPNPGLLRIKLEQLQDTAIKLSQDSGVAIPDVLTKAHRGLYRYAQNPGKVRADIKKHEQNGTHQHLRRRPDILNFPHQEVAKKERAYVAMGIPLDVVRKYAKFYVYNPETIRGRIDAVTNILESFETLTSTDTQLLLERFVTTPRLVADCGEDKIEGVAELIRQYATPAHWHEAMALLGQHRREDTPQGATLFYLGRVSLKKLTDAMEAEPTQNIFLLARDLVNKPKAEQKRKRRQQTKQSSVRSAA